MLAWGCSAAPLSDGRCRVTPPPPFMLDDMVVFRPPLRSLYMLRTWETCLLTNLVPLREAVFYSLFVDLTLVFKWLSVDCFIFSRSLQSYVCHFFMLTCICVQAFLSCVHYIFYINDAYFFAFIRVACASNQSAVLDYSIWCTRMLLCIFVCNVQLFCMILACHYPIFCQTYTNAGYARAWKFLQCQ